MIKPVKVNNEKDENRYNEELASRKTNAVRHLFLIRHGQYHTNGRTDAERTLTELGECDDVRIEGFKAYFLYPCKKIFPSNLFVFCSSSLGRKQAESTGLRLGELDHPYSLIVRSTMSRAQETSKIIEKNLPHVPTKDDSLLEEGAPIPPEPPVGHWKPEKFVTKTDLRVFYRIE